MRPYLPLFAFLICLSAASADAGEERTSGRALSGQPEWPAFLFQRQEHDEFLSYHSYQDPHHRHPQQWDGQDWAPADWKNGAWTPHIAVQKFFDAEIFTGQYDAPDGIQTVDLGSAFYKLSDIDKRRALRLLTDVTGTFKKDYKVVTLRDGTTHDMIGSYSPKGMFLK